MALDAVLARMDDTLPEAAGRLPALLRIASISTDPAYRDDCAISAEGLSKELQPSDFQAKCRPTPGHPLVSAPARLASAGANRHPLLPGHHDVQPVAPLTQWHRDAIEMTPDGPVLHPRGGLTTRGSR